MPTRGGGTHILRQTGMCGCNGSLFYKKSLNMGPIFYKKILIHGSTFLTWACENPENCKICEKWVYFSRKILNNGYPFLPKWPLKMGRGFDARAAYPRPNQIWVPPVCLLCPNASYLTFVKGIFSDFVRPMMAPYFFFFSKFDFLHLYL